MADWFKRKCPMQGLVLFRGTISPRASEFAYLDALGVQRQIIAEQHDGWVMRLKHPQWGEAKVSTVPDFARPPRQILQYDPRLTMTDVSDIVACYSAVHFEVSGVRQHILRDRKLALRFMRALMGDDGVAGIDIAAQHYWTRQALDEELAHDATLDIESLFTLHAVYNNTDAEGNHTDVWLHTHGLAELGYFDFDILRPSQDSRNQQGVLYRSLAYSIVEGAIKAGTPVCNIANPGGNLRMVPVSEFIRAAKPEDIGIRDDPDASHLENRSVICEPARGLFAALFGQKIIPNRWLSGPIDDDTVFLFSRTTSLLMAERTQGTYVLVKPLCEEFAKFHVQSLLKIGVPVDNSTADDREHLWFEAVDLRPDRVVGKLVNRPWNVAALHEGGQYEYGVEQITDWVILTPAGTITPREMIVARILRERGDELLELMRKANERPST